MRISDWSSDVCSSDLFPESFRHALSAARRDPRSGGGLWRALACRTRAQDRGADRRRAGGRAADVDRSGRSVGLRLDPAAPRLGLSARDRALVCAARPAVAASRRSEEHTSELQSLMRISYAVFCLKKTKKNIRSLPRQTEQ